ncbi:TonB-dependent receptor domain-containing protein [Sphingomonas sp.]|uniref:TonB-dependent receptor domain-containing protein n=1 Tax=Sphingomonas sp. TaxID=28214 RepID=UPI003CC578B3
MTKIDFTRSLRTGASATALLLAMTAAPAFAQTGSTTPQDATQVPGSNGQQTPSSVAIEGQRTQTTAQSSEQDQAQSDVVVTGSLFRGNAETPSPVTTLTAANLEARGINTVTEAIQRLSANGSGTLPNSFSANGAFASGASAPSLRGLTTNSTLVLFDGLRAAYYPLADDGTRNFVDINSIPNAIVERIDVLKDGASSTYGADAVAGVINVITRKQITGLRINGSAGTSEQGDTTEQRFDATYGYGDLTEQHFNFYVSGEYQHDDPLYNADRGYPYNTSNLSGLCAPSVGVYNQTTGAVIVAPGTQTCRPNGVQNGVNSDGTYVGIGTTVIPIVRPYTATNGAIAGSRYQLLNTAAGCGAFPSITLNAAQAAANTTAALTNCQVDNVQNYSVISPEIERIGASARLTLQLGDNTQAYGQFNFYQSDVFYTGAPASIRFASPNGGATINGALPTSAAIALPIYVCPLNGANATFVNSVPTTPGCTAANGTLNPNNPFAAAGQTARIITRLNGINLSNERLTRSYRAAGGINGTFGGGFDYSLEGVYMREDLKATYRGYPNLQSLLNVIADGSYNFVNQAANTAAERNILAPTRINNARSELSQVQGTIRKQLFDLPGGPLGIAVGASYRHEEIVAPSANAVNPQNPYDTINLNRFGTSGSRNVESGYFEINAPIFEQLLINGSGRYDHYSSGQSHFSPKIGAKFTPVHQISLVGTYSEGFRIPSFAESFGLPTTGFITQTPPSNYIARCTAAAGTYCTAQYSLGLTSVGNPNLKPETARNFTAGVVLNPIRNVSLRIDYYNIYKKNLITGADYGPQIAAYYAAGNVNNLTTGVTGVTVDTVGFATLPAGAAPFPLLSTIQYGFVNANSAKSTGIDVDLETAYQITPGIRWTSSLEGTYVIELSTTINGVKQRYEDSLGAYQTTSASGTPQYRASWQNTFDFGRVSLTGTAYYTAGYSEGAADDGNTPDGQACYGTGINGTPLSNGGSFTTYRDGNTVVACRVRHFIYGDVTANVRVNDNFTLYGNILNVTNAHAPYDPSTYGAYQYNPAWGNAGIIGRYFRVGARVKF